MEELKPCPFCSTQARYRKYDCMGKDRWTVYCDAMSSYLRKKYELALQGKEFCLAIFERWGRLFFNCPAHQPKGQNEKY